MGHVMEPGIIKWPSLAAVAMAHGPVRCVREVVKVVQMVIIPGGLMAHDPSHEYWMLGHKR